MSARILSTISNSLDFSRRRRFPAHLARGRPGPDRVRQPTALRQNLAPYQGLRRCLLLQRAFKRRVLAVAVTGFGVPEHHGDGSALPMLVIQSDNLSLEIWSSGDVRLKPPYPSDWPHPATSELNL